MMTSANSRFDTERRNQELEGQRMARSERTEQPRRTLSAARKPASTGGARGHEAFLNQLQASGTLIKIVYLDDIETITGRVHATDKFTITLAVDRVKGVPAMGYDKRIIFKHAIREFQPLPNVPEVSGTTAASAKAKAETAAAVEA